MDVAVLGAAMTQFGARDDHLRELLAEAGLACLESADVAPPDVDHLVVTQSGGAYEHQGGLMNALTSDLGLEPAYAEGIEQTSAAGAAGIFDAWTSITSGASDVVLVVGAEKMTHLSTAAATDGVSAITHPTTYKHGVTIPAFAGMTARAYLERFDAPREALARVAVKNHANGLDNPNAHFQREIGLETVLSSPIVADPLRLYDFCPISDGGAAVLLASEAVAERYASDEGTGEYQGEDEGHPVITGIAGATDTHVVHQRDDLTVMDAVVRAGEGAFEMAGRTSDDVDVLEVHDMFTILELLQLEALGFADHGEAWRLVERGATERDGSLPVNTSGGLKAKGHPVAASGVAQVVELYEQLRGDAGARQVAADVGMACNVGGFGNCGICTILERRS